MSSAKEAAGLAHVARLSHSLGLSQWLLAATAWGGRTWTAPCPLWQGHPLDAGVLYASTSGLRQENSTGAKGRRMMQKRSMMSGQCGLADASAEPTLGFISAGQGVRGGAGGSGPQANAPPWN